MEKKKDSAFEAFQRGFSKTGKTGAERSGAKAKRKKAYGAFGKLFGRNMTSKKKKKK